jgi:hypothetical protein
MPLNFDTVYCDLDDCLLTVNGINTNSVKFLYQCVNENKQLILITRHGQNPQETLEKNRLGDLFDKIIHIQDKDITKASKIQKNEKAIFIDNSFEERRNVAKVHKIPTFTPDNVDSLINDVLIKSSSASELT